MELYVEKELKDKIEPLEEELKQRKSEIEKIVDRLSSLDDQLRSLDKHYDGVVKAMLVKQGIKLAHASAFNILKEYQRLREVEEKARLNIKQSKKLALSPPKRDASPTADGTIETDIKTNYLTKLAPLAKSRRQSLAMNAKSRV